MKLFRKTYGVFGMVEWSTLVPMGNGNIRIDFTNGCISTRGVDPATFTTDNQVVQIAIESCAKFTSKKIRIISSFQIGETEEPVVKKSLEKANTVDNVGNNTLDTESTVPEVGEQGTTSDISESGETSGGAGVYPDVKNSQQAKDILMGEPYNISLADLGNKAAIQAKAAAIGVSFPNWK